MCIGDVWTVRISMNLHIFPGRSYFVSGASVVKYVSRCSALKKKVN